ncbi:MAG: response regulator transcription factor [Chitinophagaceae bacterium]
MNTKENWKVLVIDDDADITAMMRLVLRSEGFEVEATTRTEDIFEKARNYKPNVILLDVFLTGYDGRDICKQFKFHPETKNIPIIMISGHETVSDTIVDYGANDFLLKPFKLEALLNMIKTHLVKSESPTSASPMIEE